MRQIASRAHAAVASPRFAGPLAVPFAGLLLVGLLLAVVPQPALAKEFQQATLDAPIAMDTPGGAEIIVGMMVTALDADGMRPVEGSPVYLKLFGRDGSSTRASGVGDRIPGHYTMRIVVPTGGPRDIEVGVDGATDGPIMLTADPFAFGGITPRTAQLAPELAPASTPPVPASASPTDAGPARAAGAAAVAVADAGTSAPGPSPLPYLLAGAAAVAVVAALVVAMRRRARAVARPIAPDRAPGA